jgi:hypothetical protein
MAALAADLGVIQTRHKTQAGDPVTDDYIAETDAILKQLGAALVQQLYPPNSEDWTELDFSATRAVLEPYGETHRVRLTVRRPEGDFPLIPRPEAQAACAALDHISTLGDRPRWRTVRLLLRNAADGVKWQCWWEYDPK